MNPLRPTTLLLALIAASAAHAAPRCDAPRQPADRLACAKAAEGPDALRRFVTRTQGIYQLYYGDYATAVRTVAQQDEPQQAPVQTVAVAPR